MPLPKASGNFRLKPMGASHYYATTQQTDADEVAQLVDDIRKAFLAGEPKQLIWVLSGTHGDTGCNGTLHAVRRPGVEQPGHRRSTARHGNDRPIGACPGTVGNQAVSERHDLQRWAYLPLPPRFRSSASGGAGQSAPGTKATSCTTGGVRDSLRAASVTKSRRTT